METKSDEVYKMIRKFGTCKVQARGRDKGLYTTVCQGCGKLIRSDGELENVDYAQGKRGDAYFWHSKCMNKVWKSRIQWKDPA